MNLQNTNFYRCHKNSTLYIRYIIIEYNNLMGVLSLRNLDLHGRCSKFTKFGFARQWLWRVLLVCDAMRYGRYSDVSETPAVFIFMVGPCISTRPHGTTSQKKVIITVLYLLINYNYSVVSKRPERLGQETDSPEPHAEEGISGTLVQQSTAQWPNWDGNPVFY